MANFLSCLSLKIAINRDGYYSKSMSVKSINKDVTLKKPASKIVASKNNPYLLRMKSDKIKLNLYLSCRSQRDLQLYS